MPARRIPLAALLAALIALPAFAGGCGEERKDPPKVTGADEPAERVTLTLPGARLKLRRPQNWHFSTGDAPLVGTIVSGEAIIAIWRYRRSEPPPAGPLELKKAIDSLKRVVKQRDPSARVSSARAVTVGDQPAIEVLATERINGRVRRVRSLHLFEKGGEIVIDAYAPPRLFPRIDRTVFKPLTRSVRIT